MAQTGYTPILNYSSATASAVPLAANLSQGELALNTNDGKLFYKDSAGVVQTMASKATGAIGGSTTQVQFNNAGVLGGSASLTWSGTVLTSSGFAGPLNGTVGATTPAAGSFTTTTIGTSETLSYGTANGVTYLNGSKVVTSGSALSFDGSTLEAYSTITARASSGTSALRLRNTTSDYQWQTVAGTNAVSLFDNAVGSARLTLDSSGNVGIGTSSPTSKLDVRGNGYFINATNPTSFWSADSGLSTGSGYCQWNTSANEFRVESYTNHPLVFGTNNTERMRLDSSGNLGLGVTPSAWSGFRALQIGGTTSLWSSTSGNSSSFYTNNGYFNGSNRIYLTNGFASEYIQGAGQHIWYTAPSGTAGNTITFTQAMTLDASGRLGIGQTSPAFKLDVQVAVGEAIAVRPSTATGNAKQSALRLYGSESVTTSRYAEVACFNDTAGQDTNALTFSTGYGATIYERARISSDGNVGIGTSSPRAKFEVNGVGSFADGTAAAPTITFGNELTVGLFRANNATLGFSTGGSERMRIDSSGNVGIGVSSMLYGFTKELAINAASGTSGYSYGIAGSLVGLSYCDASNMYIGTYPANPLIFRTSNTERMRLDSSGVLIVGGTSSNPIASRTDGIAIGTPVGFSTSRGVGNWAMGLSSTSGNHIAFYTDNGTAYVGAGTISSNGATTSYNAASDYRLKDNVQPLTNALNRITQLRPVTWTWKEGHGGTQPNCEGFIAHELQSILPIAVTGEKDAVDAEGKPQYQGIDTSFLVATLTAAIQEQQALIQDLTTRLAALEAK
jgi:hypothetical protein